MQVIRRPGPTKYLVSRGGVWCVFHVCPVHLSSPRPAAKVHFNHGVGAKLYGYFGGRLAGLMLRISLCCQEQRPQTNSNDLEIILRYRNRRTSQHRDGHLQLGICIENAQGYRMPIHSSRKITHGCVGHSQAVQGRTST